MVEEKEVIEKKEEKEKGKKETNSKKKRKKLSKKDIQNRQLMWAIILMGSIILIILFVPFITTNFINKFVYLNLNFQKTKLGDIFFYSTRVPIINNQEDIVDSYSMNFRNNPKKLEKIEFSHPNDVGYIYFKKNEVVYISLDPEMEHCEDTAIALIPFAGFLRDFAKQNVSSAVSDEDYANLNNISYATCENSPDNTVIYINSGAKTEIKKTERNCYELIYNDCEITKVTERFTLLVLEKYMSYFVRKDESWLDMFK